DLPMPATLGHVNCYLVRGPSGVVLVDTGMDDASSRGELTRQLDEHGLAFGDLDTVVCTHHHQDHCGVGATLIEAGARLSMSAKDADSLLIFQDHPEVDARRATFYGNHPVPEEFEQRVTAVFPFFRNLGQRFEPTDLLLDGQQVDLGGVRFEVLITPGHTRGHVCLLQRDEGVLLTGDHVIAGDATHVSMREEVLGTDPLGRFVESLGRVRDLGPLRGFPGHGKPIADLSERADQLVRHHRARIEQVARALTDEPQSAFDLSGDVLWRRPKIFMRWLAMSQTLAYLEHLVHTGRAESIAIEGGVGYRKTSRSNSAHPS
ncbi:MAG: MBL fold metallo-hydrolase, partial [Deltaproteobacteria bacterium]|nr:MBL fold metallo-hydrolase [Deltaproteobacteria bacterium]